jgi:NAD(P)-dependent dehydrogenase (short-subunit alcohol dehydrogenase family)
MELWRGETSDTTAPCRRPPRLRSPPQIRKVLDDVAARFGGAPNAVVQCAGVATATRVLGKRGVHPLDQFERVLRVNALGSFNVMRLAAERMAAAQPDEHGERGVIINTARWDEGSFHLSRS